MKTTILTVCAAALLFTGCEKCYNCEIMTKTTTTYGVGSPNTTEPVRAQIEKCNMTPREARLYEQSLEGTITTNQNNKTVTTETTANCY